MKKNRQKHANDWPESRPAPASAGKPSWTTRQQLTIFGVALAALLLAWVLAFPEEFHYVVEMVHYPRAEDGLTTWNFFDSDLKRGGRFPVTRIFDLSRRGRGAARRSSASAAP